MKMVCPKGWVCQAVRAPGVKWTLAACTREGSTGVATVSMYTVPVNQSLGPAAVSRAFLVICMWFSLGPVGSAALGGVELELKRRRLERLGGCSPPSALGPVRDDLVG